MVSPVAATKPVIPALIGNLPSPPDDDFGVKPAFFVNARYIYPSTFFAFKRRPLFGKKIVLAISNG